MMNKGKLTAFCEVFHGCQESIEYFINQVKNLSKKEKIYVILENLSVIDGIILNYLIENGKLGDNFREYLISKRGLMLGHIIKKVKDIKQKENIRFLGIEKDNFQKISKKSDSILKKLEINQNKIKKSKTNKLDRYSFMKNEINKGLDVGLNMLYFGFHLDYSEEEGHILNDIKQKYGSNIKSYAMCSPKIKTILLDMRDIDIPKNIKNNNSKLFELESKQFQNQGGEKSSIQYIENYLPMTEYENYLKKKYKNKITLISKRKSNKEKIFRQFGIWLPVYKKGFGINNVYNKIDNYDGIIYLPKVTYLI